MFITYVQKSKVKTYNMPKCLHIDINQVNPAKIIDGWQVLKVDISRYKQLLPKMQLCKMVERRRGSGIPGATLWHGSLT